MKWNQNKKEEREKEIEKYKQKLTSDQKAAVGEERLKEALRILEEERLGENFFEQMDEKIKETREELKEKRILKGEEKITQAILLASNKQEPFSWIEEKELLEKVEEQLIIRHQRGCYCFHNTLKKSIMTMAGIFIVVNVVCFLTQKDIFSKGGFIFEKFEDFVSLKLPSVIREEKKTLKVSQKIYQPTYIPDGYQLVDTRQTERQNSLKFYNQEKDDYIIYRQSNLQASININSEKNSYKCEEINGQLLYYYEAKDSIVVVCYDGDYQFYVSSSSCKKEECFKILTSLEIKE